MHDVLADPRQMDKRPSRRVFEAHEIQNRFTLIVPGGRLILACEVPSSGITFVASRLIMVDCKK